MSGIQNASWIGYELASGRYRVDAELGEGGMGVVYRAWDKNLGTDVVIKVPHASMLQDAEFAARFGREISSLVKLSHPHIVKISDVGEADGLPFAVMQFLPGGSLEDRQRSEPDGEIQPLPPDSLDTWLASVAAALDFVHQQGYIHRDVKPANILFDAHGHAYLSDFGIAKLAAASQASAGSKTVTGAGLVIGTPEYMAPELIMGLSSDGRVDQYSLAVTVFEILAGRRPFEDATSTAVLVQHSTKEPPDLASLSPNVSAGLAAVIRKALSKSPSDRFASCREFADAVLAAVIAWSSTKTDEAKANCPICDKVLKLPEKVRGKVVACPGCKSALRASDDLRRLIIVKSASDSAAGGSDTQVARAHNPTPLRAMEPTEKPRSLTRQFRDQVATSSVNDPAASPSTQETSAFGAARSSTKPIKSPAPSKKLSRVTESPVSEHVPPIGRKKLLAVAAGGAAIVLLLGITIFVMTGRGNVKISVKGGDDSILVKVDGDEIAITGLKEPLMLHTGEHGLTVTSPTFETVTKSFKVTRGATTVVEVELQPIPSKVQTPTIPTVAVVQPAPVNKIEPPTTMAPPPAVKFDLPPIAEMRRLANSDTIAAAKVEEGIRQIKNNSHVAAAKEFEEALKVDPGLAFKKIADFDDQVLIALRALLYDDDNGNSKQSRAIELYGDAMIADDDADYSHAIASYKTAVDLDPGFSWPANNLAWLLATCPDRNVRNGKLAVEYAFKACQASNWHYWSFQNTLAAALAEAGAYEQAVVVQKLSKENYAGIRGSEEDFDKEEWALNLTRYEQGQQPDYSKSWVSKRAKRVLTEAIALRYVADPKSIDLDEFTSIEEPAAAVLGKTHGNLDLDGLARLSDVAAAALAKHQGHLFLHRLTTLTEPVALALSKHEGALVLNGLTTISEPVASALGKSRGVLVLNGMTEISETTADALAEHRGGQLHLNGLTTLSDVVATTLARHQGKRLVLNGLTTLSDSTAAPLSRYKETLSLGGLATISETTAGILARSNGGLELSGLTTLSDAVATALAQHQGHSLSFDGLTTLSQSSATALAKHQGLLYLDGLTALSDSAAGPLSKHKGMLFLNGLTTISETTAGILARSNGDLELSGLTTVSDAVATALAKHQGLLYLDGLTALSDSAAGPLSKHKGMLFLNGLTTISETTAVYLARSNGDLELSGLTTVSDAVATALAKHHGKLSLEGLTTISEAAATSLAKHQGELVLTGDAELALKRHQ